jgi:hypothetical protein
MSMSAIFLLVAVILFVISAFGVPSKISLQSLGLAFFAGSFLVGAM